MLIAVSTGELPLFAGPGAGPGTGLMEGTDGTGCTEMSGFLAAIRSLSCGVNGTGAADETSIVFSKGCSPQTQVLSHTCNRMRNLSAFGPGGASGRIKMSCDQVNGFSCSKK